MSLYIGVVGFKLTAGDLSLLFALSQHFIILSFGECSGVPDTTPPARAISMKSNVIRVIIQVRLTQKMPVPQ